MHTPEEAAAYLRKLRSILMFLDICDGNMEEGSFRCDANISLRPKGQKTLGVKTELKNMNSFRNVQRALDYEIRRQTALLDQGERILQETRLWDAARGVTSSMRGKEEAHDYRYFPDPDLVPIVVDPEWIAAIKAGLPELPDTKKERFIREYGIPEYDAEVLTSSKPLANYYEACLQVYAKPKIVSNWIMSELLRELKRDEREIEDCPVPAQNLAEMLKLIDEGLISGKIAKSVFEEMYRTGKKAEEVVKEKGWVQVTDTSAIEKSIEEILAKNPKEVEEYKKGKEKLFGFFVGQVMKATQGKANPQLVNELLKKKLMVS
jgi:aspartyl-tRNA(Asn)/glutamyl-tRNA(Gln) amidotransferase subunit B